jgi:hypothetical protein
MKKEKKPQVIRKETEKSMILYLDSPERAKLKVIQSNYVETGCDKTLTEIALDCLKIGIHNKMLNLNEKA